ncbi:MAG: RidA family protein [Burkholderiales bacterium]|nr:RidA family protein [Burkholderiales bacterium]
MEKPLSATPPSNPYRHWANAVAAGPFLFVSGQLGWTRDGSRLCGGFDDAPAPPDDTTASGYDWVARMEGRVGAQTLAIYEQYRALLRGEGAGLANILRYHIFQRDKRYFPVFNAIRRKIEPAPPASTAVGMGRFTLEDDASLCVDGIVLRGSAVATLGLREVRPGASRHTAAAHFSHVIGAGPFLFLAGQIPIDGSKPGSPLIRNFDDIPPVGRFLQVGRSHEDTRTGPIAAQTWFTYDLIRQHLEAEGASLKDILNVVVYLQDMRDFPSFHRVHERFFGDAPPALTVIEAREVGHKGTLIEIEPTALVPGRGIARSVCNPPGWRAPAKMSALVQGGDLAFLSGIAGTTEQGNLAQDVRSLGEEARRDLGGAADASAVELQCACAVAELKRRLGAAGHAIGALAQLSVYLRDIAEWPCAEAILLRACGDWRPALTVLESPFPAPLAGARVSLSAIGWFGSVAPAAI